MSTRFQSPYSPPDEPKLGKSEAPTSTAGGSADENVKPQEGATTSTKKLDDTLIASLKDFKKTMDEMSAVIEKLLK